MSKPQRQKAGVKSASSQLAADLLGSPGFITFDALSSTTVQSESEDAISLKKLAKRDSSTREKALRELLSRTVESKEDAVFATFSHISSIIERLAFDCAHTVRVLLMRLLSRQIAILKKRAEKQMRDILPWVFFCTCDGYPPVAAEASSLLSLNLAPPKITAALNAISPRLLQTLREVLIDESSPLLVPTKEMSNDEEDTAEGRKKRLVEQSLSLLAKLLREGPDPAAADGLLKEYFKKNANKKGIVTRRSLDTLMASADAVEVVLSTSFVPAIVAPFKEAAPETMAGCADLLLLLLRDSRFVLTPQLRKTIVEGVFAAIKSASTIGWGSLEVSLLPLFSAVSCIVEEQKREAFVSRWFKELQCNSFTSARAVKGVADCIRYVMGTEKWTEPERGSAMDMYDRISDKGWSGGGASELASLTVALLPRLNSQAIPFLQRTLTTISTTYPTSSEGLRYLLSSLPPSFSWAWKFAHDLGVPVPLSLLSAADDDLMGDLSLSLPLLSLMEKEGTASLGPLYERVLRVTPPSSLPSTQLGGSELSTALLSSLSQSSLLQLEGRVGTEAETMALNAWAKKKDVDALLHYLRNSPSAVDRVGEKLLSMEGVSALSFLAPVSLHLGDSSRRPVAERCLVEMLALPIEQVQAITSSAHILGLLRLLPPSHVLSSFSSWVEGRGMEASISALQPTATLLYSLVDGGVGVLDEDVVLGELASVLESLSWLSPLSRLCCPWPSPVSSFPSSSLSSEESSISSLESRIPLWTALYVFRGEDSPSALLLLLVIVYSQLLSLAVADRRESEKEDASHRRLLSLAEETIEGGLAVMDAPQLSSLLVSVLSSPLLSSHRSFLIACLRPLTKWVKQASLPSTTPSPFSQGCPPCSEWSRQLYFGRDPSLVLRHLQQEYATMEEANELFLVEGSEGAMADSVAALEAGWRRVGEEGEGPLFSPETQDFLLCGLLTALNSVESSREESEEGRLAGNRCLLASAAFRFALAANKNSDSLTEEWKEFFLPSLVTSAIRLYPEVGSWGYGILCRYLGLFLSSLPSIQWSQDAASGWENRAVCRFDHQMDGEGVPASIQTLVLRVEEQVASDRPEDIVAAAKILAMCARETISIGNGSEEETLVTLPSFLTRILHIEAGWGKAAVLYAATSLVEGGGAWKDGEERAVMCDALATVVRESLAVCISRAEEREEYWKRETYEKGGHGLRVSFLSSLLHSALSSFPTVCMTWWTALPRSGQDLVISFVCAALSPLLVDEALAEVVQADLPAKFSNDNANVLVRRNANEIVMEYVMEDTRMRLSLQLPKGWPLVPDSVHVEGSVVGVSDSRRWMLMLKSQLHKNSTVVSALAAWLKVVGRRVENADTCTICMQIVDPQTKQLPRIRCRTCNNKFHKWCIEKWFKSSNQTTCPLCRTEFVS